jgi:hypothetical protein
MSLANFTSVWCRPNQSAVLITEVISRTDAPAATNPRAGDTRGLAPLRFFRNDTQPARAVRSCRRRTGRPQTPPEGRRSSDGETEVLAGLGVVVPLEVAEHRIRIGVRFGDQVISHE